MKRKLNAKVTLELLAADFVVEVGLGASEVSPYFQTTIKMGNRDMQELTNRAVEMAFGVGFFGGEGTGAPVLLLIWEFGAPPSLLCSSFLAVAPSFETMASQRMVKCWERVVKAQRKK